MPLKTWDAGSELVAIPARMKPAALAHLDAAGALATARFRPDSVRPLPGIQTSHSPAELDDPDVLFLTSADLTVRNGPAIHVLNVCNALAEDSLHVVLAAPRPTGALALPLDPRVTLDPCPDPRQLGLPGAAASALLLAKLWRYRRAGVRYVRSAPGSLLLTEAARRISRGPLAVEFNGWIEDEVAIAGPRLLAPLASLLGWCQGREARLADRIRVVTERLAARAIAQGADAEAVRVISTGTQLDVFRPLDRAECRARLGIAPESRLAVFVGNLWPVTDLATAIEALAQLGADGLRVELAIVGDGPLRGRLEAIAAAARSAGACSVTFTGALSGERAAVHLGAADVAIAPFTRRRNDAIGLSPLKIRDYAACGRVIVASRLPGIAELECEPWLHAAEPEDAAAFAAALVDALKPGQAAAEARAREFAVDNFGWGRVAEAIIDMIGLKAETLDEAPAIAARKAA